MKTDTLRSSLQEVENRMHRMENIVPLWRKAFRERYSFSGLPFAEQFPIWQHIWQQGQDYRVRSQPVYFCETFLDKKEQLAASWEMLHGWQDQVDDWGYCDSLAKVYTKILELRPAEVYAQLSEWNTDADLWKRRQSVVSLLYYSRTKKVVLPYKKIIRLIDPLLEDKEYYVQKGVGWSLRELHNIYPGDAHAYMDKNIRRISAIAFAAATEKMNTETKAKLKLKRK
jgi:3-methyladenine DNA glycosylase AlkD